MISLNRDSDRFSFMCKRRVLRVPDAECDIATTSLCSSELDFALIKYRCDAGLGTSAPQKVKSLQSDQNLGRCMYIQVNLACLKCIGQHLQMLE